MGNSALGSFSGFLGGGGGGSTAPELRTGNSARDILTKQLESYGKSGSFQDDLSKYATGKKSLDQALQGIGNAPGARDEFATNPYSGSLFATNQVQNNPITGQLFGQNGLMGKEIGKEQDLQNQGFQLTPGDQTMYGQMSGDIARMFGQQGNDISQNLASRGLASAPSGAAGAMFSGLQGNQNEMLAKAQQQILQQRFQNTMQQIGQQQSFISQLGNQGQQAIQNQYGRQLSGSQQDQQKMQGLAGIQTQANSMENSGGLAASEFNAANKPKNFGDFMTSGMGQALQAGSGGAVKKGFDALGVMGAG